MSNVFSEVVKVSPSLATAILEHNDINRPVSKTLVDFYAQEMEGGNWRLNGESIKIADDGTLLDGQHHMYAIIKCGKTIEMVITRGIDKDTFSTIDQGKQRTLRDVANCKKVEKASQKSAIAGKYFPLKRGLIIADAERRGKCSRTTGKGQSSKAEMLQFILKHDDIFNEVIDALKNLYKRTKFMPLSTMGAMALFIVLDRGHYVEQAADFFTQLCTGRTEMECISILHQKISNQQRSQTVKLTNRHLQNLIIKCWNYYITGNDVKKLRWDANADGNLTFK